ncbi:MAG: hypothetical protein AAGI46_13015, partial [Planctomycetota bacterium]
FELRRLRLDEPRDLRTDVAADGTRTEGLLDTYTLEVQRNLGGDLLRRGLAPLPDADAGVFAIRYSTGVDTRLHQEAIIQGDDRTIFRLTMVSEAPGGPVERMSADENVRRSVKLFNDAFASFALIDQAALADEQDKRLRKTRAMFVQLGPRGNLASAAQGEFFLAIQRNGETIGVAHVIEEPADLLPPTSFEAFEDAKVRGPALEPLLANGVRVGIRMRLRDGDAILDRATWSYASRELDIGDFREHTRRVPLGGEPVDEADTGVSVGTVIGQMRSRRVPVRGEPQSRGPGLGERQTFEIKDQRKLEVVFTVDGNILGDPLERDLPAFYVPAAVDHLLPRLVATWGRDGYMVASYVPERREVMSRYLDVQPPAEVSVPGGGRREAYIVSSRIGFTGEPTRHYVDAETFNWLGSITPSQGVQVFIVTRDQALAELEALSNR